MWNFENVLGKEDLENGRHFKQKMYCLFSINSCWVCINMASYFLKNVLINAFPPKV